MDSKDERSTHAPAPAAGGDRTPPSLEEGYRAYRSLFLAILGRLAAKGWVADVGDGLEIVHDFFTREWDGLARRYQPARATFRAYAAQAFRRFAKQRIHKAHRQSRRLALFDIDPWDDTPIERQLDRERAWSLIETLPELEAIAVRARFKDGATERQIAAELDVSRHRARELLADGITRIIVRMGARRGYDPRDWAIARSLWVEERSLADTAAVHGVTETQVKLARARVIQQTRDALRRSDGGSSSR